MMKGLFFRDPNGAVPNASASEAKNSQKGHEEMNTPYWDTYDTINQLYLELGKKLLCLYFSGNIIRYTDQNIRETLF